MRRHYLLVALVVTVLPEPAWAHLVSTRFGELYAGLMHPLTTLQHLVPWVGLGLLGGLLQTDTSRLALLSFPLAVGSGALIAAAAPQVAIIDGFNLLTFVLLGVLVALAADLGRATFLSLAVVVGLSHGYANGTTELAGGQLTLYVAGVTLAGYLLVTLTMGLTHFVATRLTWGSIAIRAAGSWIVAVGLVFGTYRLTLIG